MQASSTVKKGVVIFSETLLPGHQTTRCHVQDNYSLLHICRIAHSIICTRLFRGKMHSDCFNGIEILQGRWQRGEKVGYYYPSRFEKTLCKWDIYVPLVTKGLNPLNPELNTICYLLALLGAHHLLHVSRIRVKLLTFRLQMSYIYGAPILDVSRSHTTTQHSR